MFSILQQNTEPIPMSDEMFENFKKHLPPTERNKFEKRHQQLKKFEAQRKQQKEQKLSEVLDSETLMRFAYVPFVVAQLAWDYADTIVDVASMLKLHPTKKLCRAVRELKRQYDRVRDEFTNYAHRDSEIDNMYVFEDGVSDLFSLYLKNIEFDLKSEYPDLGEDNRNYLLAIYQCHIVLQCIYRYAEMQKVKIEKNCRTPDRRCASERTSPARHPRNGICRRQAYQRKVRCTAKDIRPVPRQSNDPHRTQRQRQTRRCRTVAEISTV